MKAFWLILDPVTLRPLSSVRYTSEEEAIYAAEEYVNTGGAMVSQAKFLVRNNWGTEVVEFEKHGEI